VAAVVMGRPAPERSVARQIPASRQREVPSTVPSAAPAEEAGTARPETKRNAPVPPPPVPAPARLEEMPDVLVPDEQRVAVSRLFASLRAGRPEVISMLMSLHRGEAGADSRGLTIEPIRIEPVVVSALPSTAFIFDK